LAATIREAFQTATTAAAPPNADLSLQKCYENLSKKFDPKYGGFGSAPKFPKAG
jgi:uncharacterized protein YyaL (SSP411 family)